MTSGRAVRKTSITAVSPISVFTSVIVACIPIEKASAFAAEAVSCRRLSLIHI